MENNDKIIINNQNSIRPAFYEENFAMQNPIVEPSATDISNPVSIFNYLTSNVYKQDEYCRTAAMILYNHAKGITSRNFVCGPAGNGKTFVWQLIKKIWPNTIIINAATLTQEGFKGDNKATGFLSQVDFNSEEGYIIVYDEFDKCIAPCHTNLGDDVAAKIQSEMLKLVEGDTFIYKGKTISTVSMSFVFCGSFAVKAQDIAEDSSGPKYGFVKDEHETKAYDRELTIQDVIEYGVVPELASRSTRICNVRPLTLEDYRFLIKDHPASPLHKLEAEYGLRITISDDKLSIIAANAYHSGLGVRNARAQLQRMIDDAIFEGFASDNITPGTLEL